jgi:ParB-like chromosome segregation protein Spo0J
MATPKVYSGDPRQLRPHPLNKYLYGAPQLPQDFVDSVRNGGVREPIRVTQAMTIISGHRRAAAAIEAGLTEVPVVIEGEALDDFAIRRELIVSNKQRAKSTEQIAREFSELAAVETELAKQRQASTGTAPGRKKNASVKNDGSDNGEAVEKAAAAVGLSKNTAKKAKAVVAAIDQAEAAGKTAKAADLRDTLNNKSVAAAHRKATGSTGTAMKAEQATDSPVGLDAVGQPIPRRLDKAFAGRTTCDAVLVQLSQIQKEANKFAELPGGEVFKQNAQAVAIDIKNVRAAWRFARPFAVCPKCKASGKDCEACDQRGWVTEDAYKRIPKDEQC